MEIEIISDLVIILGLASLVNLLFNRFNVPNLLGFLVTGILAGPHGLGFVKHSHEIEVLAEIGVIMLLFTIGIEFSIKSLLRIRKIVLLGGSLQVGLCVGGTYLIMQVFGFDVPKSVFGGFLVALSSTAIVMKVLQERAEMGTQQGKAALGILIFQDIIIVPMILLTPMLAGQSANVTSDLLLLLVKGGGLIILTFLLARYLMPALLHRVARARNQELFLLTILVFGLAVAWLTSSLGLSLALGAFLAGLAISESEYSHHAFGNIMPFRDIFTAFFFVSVGMLLDTHFLAGHLALVLALAFAVLLFKTIIIGGVSFLLGFPFRTTVVVGLVLSQIGEFSFLLSKIGHNHALLSDYYYQLFLAVTIITMSLAPFIIMGADRLSAILLKLPLPERLVQGLYPLPKPEEVDQMQNHLIIVGMGVNGQNVANAAKMTNIPYVVVDLNADIVQEEQKRGTPIFYGDATHANVLEHAHIRQAEVLVVAIPVAAATYAITANARRLNPQLHIIIRTRFVGDVTDLYKAGANEVIPEEYETSVEIFSRVLNKYLIPKTEIDKLVSEVRADGYNMFRGLSLPERDLSQLETHLPDMEIHTMRVADDAKIKEKTLGEINLRNEYEVTLLALRRGAETLTNPQASTRIYAGDILVLLGSPRKLACANELFVKGETPVC